jgi:excisionase family DNA binding protein
VTPATLAGYLSVHERTIMRMIDAGALHAFKVGREWRIPTDEARRVFPVERTQSA